MAMPSLKLVHLYTQPYDTTTPIRQCCVVPGARLMTSSSSLSSYAVSSLLPLSEAETRADSVSDPLTLLSSASTYRAGCSLLQTSDGSSCKAKMPGSQHQASYYVCRLLGLLTRCRQWLVVPDDLASIPSFVHLQLCNALFSAGQAISHHTVLQQLSLSSAAVKCWC